MASTLEFPNDNKFICRPSPPLQKMQYYSSVHVFRHQDTYFVYYLQRYQSSPGRVYDMIPKSPTKLDEWAKARRKELASILELYQDEMSKRPLGRDFDSPLLVLPEGETLMMTKTYLNSRDPNFTFKDVFEVDLDHMLLGYQGCPMYHLDNMPPKDIFIQSCPIMKSGNWLRVLKDTPVQYRLDIARFSGPRPVEDTARLAGPHPPEDGQLSVYQRRLAGLVSDTHDILSLHTKLSNADDVSLRLLEHHVGDYMYANMHMITQEIALAGEWDVTERPQVRDIMLTIATAALLPIHLLPSTLSQQKKHRVITELFKSEKGPWFLRKHLCLTLVSHFRDACKFQQTISELVELVLTTPGSPNIVYGVVFSLYHCVVVRVDKEAGTFKHTEVLRFLPNIASTHWSTPGMELLTRLRNLRAQDDVDYFHSLLSPMWWLAREKHLEDGEQNGGSNDTSDCALSSQQPPPNSSHITWPRQLRLPREVLSMISQYLTVPEFLLNFALASRDTMAAAIPRLRLPQLRTASTRTGAARYEHTFILESCVTTSTPYAGEASHQFETTRCDRIALLELMPIDGWEDSCFVGIDSSQSIKHAGSYILLRFAGDGVYKKKLHSSFTYMTYWKDGLEEHERGEETKIEDAEDDEDAEDAEDGEDGEDGEKTG